MIMWLKSESDEECALVCTSKCIHEIVIEKKIVSQLEFASALFVLKLKVASVASSPAITRQQL